MLWSLRVAQDDVGARARWLAEADRRAGGTRALLEALADAPAMPAFDPPADVDGLTALLDDPPGEDPLARAVRLALLTRGLDRQAALGQALDALADRRPDHPWVVQALARWAGARGLLAGIDALFTTLDLPFDPSSTPRMTVVGAWSNDDDDDDDEDDEDEDVDGDDPKGREDVAGAWLLERDGDHATLMDDRLRRRKLVLGRRSSATGPLPKLEPRDLDADLRDCWLGTEGVPLGPGPRRHATAGSLALRAWWALRAGRPWSAACLAQACAPDETRRPGREADALSWIAVDVARAVQLAAFVDLGDLRPRGPIAATLRRTAAALDLPPRLGPLDPAWDDPERLELRAEVLDLAARLEAQEAALRDAPPLPTWDEWQALEPAERLPHLLRALPDLDGDPVDVLGFGGGSPWGATQRVPPDAPPRERRPGAGGGFVRPRLRPASGRSAADGLVELGEVAVPALIDVMHDLSPTRCVGNDGDEPALLLTVGAVAEQVLLRIADLDPLEPTGDLGDHAAYRRAMQVAARAWWEAWAPRGGLVAWHLDRLHVAAGLADPEAHDRARARHLRWLLRHADGRERGVVEALVRAERDPTERARWIDALSAARGDAYHDLLLEALASDDDALAMAAGAALLARGDRRALVRAGPLARAAVSGERPSGGGPDRALGLVLTAQTPEAPGLVVLATATRPDLDAWMLQVAPRLPAPESFLSLARLAARPRAAADRAAWVGEHARAALAARLGLGDAVAAVDALAEALRLRPDDEAREHAAVTAALLGGGALASVSSRAGVDLRGPLLAALVTDDLPRRHAAEAALERLDADALAWLAQVARGPARAAVDEARARAADADARVQRRRAWRVVEVTVAPGVPGDVRARVETWWERPLDLALVADLLAAWEDAFAGALEVVIERPASGGVHVRLSGAPGPRPEGPWPLVVEVDLPGLVRRHADASARCPSGRVDEALAGAQAALADDAPARVTVRAWR
ncbi:MAG: hypothetical protein M9894_12215 [Planctomycetes bacterium]|nr:hypothetical protein [Planctomycetota bacterium]